MHCGPPANVSLGPLLVSALNPFIVAGVLQPADPPACHIAFDHVGPVLMGYNQVRQAISCDVCCDHGNWLFESVDVMHIPGRLLRAGTLTRGFILGVVQELNATAVET